MEGSQEERCGNREEKGEICPASAEEGAESGGLSVAREPRFSELFRPTCGARIAVARCPWRRVRRNGEEEASMAS